ncbi:MAG: hypothetical protein R2729_21355 [Bryobacteraceae bacterium]
MRPQLLTCALLMPLTLAASDWDFDDAVGEFERHYQTRRVSIPFVGLADFAASLVGAPFGVRDLKVAMFEHVNTDGREPFADRVPAGWRPIVRVRERNGESVAIFGRDEESWIRMLVMTVERSGGDATMVQFRLRPTEFMRFVASKARRHAEQSE